MTLDPDMARVLELMARAGGRPVETSTVAEARAGAWSWMNYTGDPDDVASVVDRYIPGPTADLPIRIYAPSGTGPFPALVMFHGSGWVISNIDHADTAHRALANSSGSIVVAVNYQKAPEHKFPVPLFDAYASVEWVAANAAALGIDPTRIGVGGDSAGGNLAAAVCLLARERKNVEISVQLLVYPATHYGACYPSLTENAEGYLLTRAAVDWFWKQYLPNPADGSNPLASPMLAEDLGGLPPAIVVTAEYDPLRDEGEAYAARLAEAGVPTVSRRYAGAVHAFMWMLQHVPASRALIDDLGRDLRRVWSAGKEEQ
jgi:acetyl esterase